MRGESISNRIERLSIPEPNTGCHLWLGAQVNRYGKVKVGRAFRAAHRVAWELAHGPIPPGLCVLHRCDTPLCVNPAHLWLGTNADNSADMVAKDRQARGERCARTKLTDAQVKELRSLRRAGASYWALAEHFGISDSQAWNIVTGASRARA